MTRTNLIFLVASLTTCLVGCASTEVSTKVDLLEKGIADLRRAQGNLTRRIDEMQIQISLLSRKLADRPGTAPASVPEKPPDLKVVKLHPETETNGKAAKAAIDQPGHPKGDAPKGSNQLTPVDPDQVQERLPVDPAAARRPLMGVDGTAEVTLEDNGEEVAVTREFDQAFTAYRAVDLDKAIPALRAFADRHPDHELAADALYYLGKAQLSLEKVNDAQQAFAALFELHPKSKRAAEALLLEGKCHEKSGRPEDARNVYLQLVQAFPRSEEATEANRRLQSIR